MHSRLEKLGRLGSAFGDVLRHLRMVAMVTSQCVLADRLAMLFQQPARHGAHAFTAQQTLVNLYAAGTAADRAAIVEAWRHLLHRLLVAV